MKKKNLKDQSYLGLNFNDFRWCIQNDFQVYVVPLVENDMPTNSFKIAVRRNGITTNGKDYIKVNGVKYKSKETLSELTFKNQKQAFDHFNYVYAHLRKKYG